MREEIRVEGFGPAISHYTDAVRFGDLLFVSGVIAVDHENKVVGAGDVVAQARQAFANLGKVLAKAGMGFADVLKITVFLTDVNDRPKINPVRQEFFGATKPASTLVEVAALVFPELKIEVEAVAGKRR